MSSLIYRVCRQDVPFTTRFQAYSAADHATLRTGHHIEVSASLLNPDEYAPAYAYFVTITSPGGEQTRARSRKSRQDALDQAARQLGWPTDTWLSRLLQRLGR